MKESPFQNFSAYNWSKSQMLFVWNPEIASQWGTKLWQELPHWQPSDWTDAPTNKKRKTGKQKHYLHSCFSFSSLTRSWWMQYKIVLINHIHILQKKKKKFNGNDFNTQSNWRQVVVERHAKNKWWEPIPSYRKNG